MTAKTKTPQQLSFFFFDSSVPNQTIRIYVDLLPDEGKFRIVARSEEGQILKDVRVSLESDLLPPGLREILNFPGFRVSALTLEKTDPV